MLYFYAILPTIDSLQWVLHYLFVPTVDKATPSLANQYN